MSACALSMQRYVWEALSAEAVLRVCSPRSICTAGHGNGLNEAAMGAGPLPPVALPMTARSTCRK